MDPHFVAQGSIEILSDTWRSRFRVTIGACDALLGPHLIYADPNGPWEFRGFAGRVVSPKLGIGAIRLC